MPTVRRVIVLVFTFSSLLNAGKILTIYSDVGFPPGGCFNTWQANGTSVIFDNYSTNFSSPPEGYQCSVTISTSWAGWGMFYGDWGANPQNLTDYYGGDLRFWIWTSTGSVRFQIETTTTSYSENLTDHGWQQTDINKWKHIVIPLSEYTAQGATFDAVKSPFKLCLDQGATVYVDLIRWTTGVALDTMYIELKHRETHIDVSSVTWTPVLPSTWNVADVYLKLDFDPGTTYWGIQIYTNNKETNANPKYTGTGNPAGLLVSTATTTTAEPLPMSWTIEDDTRTVSSLGKGTPEDWVSGGGAYKWIEDRDTTGFYDGKGYVTLWNRKGVLWNTWDSGGSDTRGWKNSPNYIYFGSNFDKAKAGIEYKTNRLIIELYYE